MAEKIVIDAGHGGANPGAVYQGRRESDDALKIAMALGRILEENGYDVIFTRTTDTTQSVGQKAAIANEENADLFVSIHRNAGEYPGQYSGVQTLIYDDSGLKKEMAQQIDENLAKLGFRDAGVSIRPNLVVLNSTQMPALLVEAGFIDSEKDNELLDSRFQAVVQAIADGIMDTLEKNGSGAGITGNSMPVMPIMPMSGETMPDDGCGCETYYRVQVGAFSKRENAEQLLQALLADGLPAFLLYEDDLYKVQVGAFSKLTNAINMERQVRDLGYSTYITT